MRVGSKRKCLSRPRLLVVSFVNVITFFTYYFYSPFVDECFTIVYLKN